MSRILDLLSIAHNEMQHHADVYENRLERYDTESILTAKEAKEIVLEELDLTIQEVIKLRNEIANRPYKELKEEYLNQ